MKKKYYYYYYYYQDYYYYYYYYYYNLPITLMLYVLFLTVISNSREEIEDVGRYNVGNADNI